MVKTRLTKAAMKKGSIVLAVFVISCCLTGLQLANRLDEAAVQEYGEKMAALKMEGQAFGEAKFSYSTLDFAPQYRMDAEHPEDSELTASPGSAADMAVPVGFKEKKSEDKPDTMPSAPEKKTGFVYVKEIPISKELQEYTYDLCKQRGLDYELVLAVMWRESRFKATAVNLNTNGTQDSGIMQINDVNKNWLAKELGVDDLMDPKQNINAGTAILAKLAKKHGIEDALVAYQYGEAGMRKRSDNGTGSSRQIQILYSQRAYYKTLTDQAKEK